jgi:hypothetical protein
MKRPREVLIEIVCPACDGTGLQKVNSRRNRVAKFFPRNARNVSAKAE